MRRPLLGKAARKGDKPQMGEQIGTHAILGDDCRDDMASEYSGDETRERAALLAEQIGSVHTSITAAIQCVR